MNNKLISHKLEHLIDIYELKINNIIIYFLDKKPELELFLKEKYEILFKICEEFKITNLCHYQTFPMVTHFYFNSMRISLDNLPYSFVKSDEEKLYGGGVPFDFLLNDVINEFDLNFSFSKLSINLSNATYETLSQKLNHLKENNNNLKINSIVLNRDDVLYCNTTKKLYKTWYINEYQRLICYDYYSLNSYSYDYLELKHLEIIDDTKLALILLKN